MEVQTREKTPVVTEDTSSRRGTEAPRSTEGAPRAAMSGAETIIAGETLFEGRLVAQGQIRIDGQFKGEIAANSRITVGNNGRVEATIEAKDMVISGRVVGNLKILERLEILSTGELYGDLEIQPGALIIEKGAKLEGRCSMGLAKGKQAGASAPAAAPPSAQGAQRPAERPAY